MLLYALQANERLPLPAQVARQLVGHGAIGYEIKQN